MTKVKKCSELTVDDLAQYCEEAGLSVKELCVSVARLTKAQKIIKYEYGVDPVYDEDNNTQLKAVQTAFELLKLVGGKVVMVGGSVAHQMAPGDIERLEAISTELKGLEGRLAEDKVQQGRVEEAVIVSSREVVPQ